MNNIRDVRKFVLAKKAELSYISVRLDESVVRNGRDSMSHSETGGQKPIQMSHLAPNNMLRTYWHTMCSIRKSVWKNRYAVLSGLCRKQFPSKAMNILYPLPQLVKSLRSSPKLTGLTASLAILAMSTGMAFGDLIPAGRLASWTTGLTVGVPGGIPTNRTNLIDVTQSPYNADKTGVNDASSAIQSAINAAGKNAVVYLPAGNYLIGSGLNLKSYMTLRGAGASTVLKMANSSSISASGNYATLHGGGAADAITAGATLGSTNITIASTANYGVGYELQISAANTTGVFSDPIVIDVSGYNYKRSQKAIVTAKTATTLTFWPPLMADWSSFAPMLNYAIPLSGVGMENMYINATNTSAAYIVHYSDCYASWLQNVRVDGSKSYTVYFADCLNSEIVHSHLGAQNRVNGSNGAGFLLEYGTGILFENNIVGNSYPGTEINFGTCGCVFAYNFYTNTDNITLAIDCNHGGHNEYNLFEGNILPNVQSDGYFGSDSDETWLRNWVHGLEGGAVTYSFAIKRFSRDFSVVGNIFEAPGWTYPDNGTSYGYPNIGNSGFVGYGPPWTDGNTNGPGTLSQSGNTVTVSQPFFQPNEVWNPNNGQTWGLYINGNDNPITGYISPTSVTVQNAGNFSNVTGWMLTAGTWGFQEMDTNVLATTIRAGNYYYFSQSIPALESLGANILPNSLYLASAPAWFGNLVWPPINPANPARSTQITNIPAGYRYVYGIDPPGVGQAPVAVAGANPTSGLAPLPVVFSSAGSSDPGGATLTYSWAFGDGTTSTAANPSHTYQSAGVFTAVMTVSNGTNQASATPMFITVTNQVSLNQPPVAAASANPVSGSAPLTVAFSSAGSSDPEGAALTYSWAFGDGGTSTSANPNYTYQAAGVYSAQLTVSDGTNQTSSQVVTITVNGGGVTNNGLVAAYGFEEGSGSTVSDISGNGNTGAISGATWTTAGYYGKALLFSGTNSVVTVNNSASLDLTTGMTLEAWVLPSAFNPAVWQCVVLKPDNSGSLDYALQGASRATPQAPSLGLSFLQNNLFAPSVLPLNTWSHLAGTFDGTTVRLYVNGVQVASQAQSGTIGTSTQPLSIGMNWAGMIDELRIYNRALGASEIQADMGSSVVSLAPAPPPPTGLRLISN